MGWLKVGLRFAEVWPLRRGLWFNPGATPTGPHRAESGSPGGSHRNLQLSTRLCATPLSPADAPNPIPRAWAALRIPGETPMLIVGPDRQLERMFEITAISLRP